MSLRVLVLSSSTYIVVDGVALYLYQFPAYTMPPDCVQEYQQCVSRTGFTIVIAMSYFGSTDSHINVS